MAYGTRRRGSAAERSEHEASAFSLVADRYLFGCHESLGRGLLSFGVPANRSKLAKVFQTKIGRAIFPTEEILDIGRALDGRGKKLVGSVGVPESVRGGRR